MSKELEDKKYYLDVVDNLEFAEMYFEANEMKSLVEYLFTPPTAEEVCKALSEQLKTPIKIGKNKHGITFNYVTGKTIISVNYNLINITVQLPPHLITMIGRFYGSLEEVVE